MNVTEPVFYPHRQRERQTDRKRAVVSAYQELSTVMKITLVWSCDINIQWIDGIRGMKLDVFVVFRSGHQIGPFIEMQMKFKHLNGLCPFVMIDFLHRGCVRQKLALGNRGPFQYKDDVYLYRNSHYKDGTVTRLSYLYNRDPHNQNCPDCLILILGPDRRRQAQHTWLVRLSVQASGLVDWASGLCMSTCGIHYKFGSLYHPALHSGHLT